jgi:DNA-binding GntR family transcriptional regulator
VWDELIGRAAATSVSPDQAELAHRLLREDVLTEKVAEGAPEIRIALEGIAARSAAEHRSSFHLARPRGAIAEIRATDTGNPRAMAAANLTFHQSLRSAGATPP